MRNKASGLGISGLLCAIALAGGWSASAQAQAPVRLTEVSETSHPYVGMNCAQLPIQVRPVGSLMEVVVGSESRLLMQAISGSGARYVAPCDPDTEFWGKGGVANVTWSGTKLPTCAEAGALVTPFRASGNEPFWAIDFDGWKLSLTEPGQPVRQFDIQGRETRDGGLTLQAAADGDRLQVDFTQAVCHDTMSGMPRPYTVTLNMNEQRLQGCGGDPARLLQGGRWALQSVAGKPVTVSAWIEFLTDNRLAGFNGCNRLIGSYAISGEGMSFPQLGSTRMACPPEVMAQADTVEQHLSGVRAFSFDRQGALVLATDRGDVVAVME